MFLNFVSLLYNVQAALAAKISPTLAARPTGIFPGVPAAQSTPGQDITHSGGPAHRDFSRCPGGPVHPWLPILARVKHKVLLLVAKSQQGLAPKYLCELMSKPP